MSQDGRRRRPRRILFWLPHAVVILRPLLNVLTKRDWRGTENLPSTGGVIVVTNHVSHVDPLTFAHFLFDNGRLPRYLAKEGLFRVFFVGQVLRGTRQIPVDRKSTRLNSSHSQISYAVFCLKKKKE